MKLTFKSAIGGLALAALLPLAAPASAAGGPSPSGAAAADPAGANVLEDRGQPGALVLAAVRPGRAVISAGPLPDLIVKDLQLNRRCELLITVANIGAGGVPESAYHRTQGAAVQMYQGATPWGGIRLFAIDPAKKLKTPGTQVTWKWFPGAANLKLGPGIHSMRAIVDNNNAVKESNERNNSRTERLRCGGPGGFKAPGGGKIPGGQHRPGGPHGPCKGARPQLTYAGSQPYSTSAGQFVRYRIPVKNWKQFCPAMFHPAPNLPPCGLNHNSSRTWVHIYNGSTNQYIYGFCAFSAPQDLTKIWFSVPKGKNPPKLVYIIVKDRQTGQNYVSNKVTITP